MRRWNPLFLLLDITCSPITASTDVLTVWSNVPAYYRNLIRPITSFKYMILYYIFYHFKMNNWYGVFIRLDALTYLLYQYATKHKKVLDIFPRICLYTDHNISLTVYNSHWATESGKSSLRNSLQIILFCQRRDEHYCCHRPMTREHAWAFSTCENIKKFSAKENAIQCSKGYQCIRNRFPSWRTLL